MIITKQKELKEILRFLGGEKKIFLLGESMGGLISFLIAADSPGLFNGLICISPAFVNRYKLGALECIKMLTQLFYNPKKGFKLPLDSSMCTRDVEYIKKLDQDPREYRRTSAKLISDILLAQVRAKMIARAGARPGCDQAFAGEGVPRRPGRDVPACVASTTVGTAPASFTIST